MRKLDIVLAVVAFCVSAPVTATSKDQAEWLFVHTADAIEIQEGNSLVFPVEREIFAFTDRPGRDYRYLNAHEFVDLWDVSRDSFENDPPNAVLTWVANGGANEAEIELIDAKVLNHGRNIAYQIDIESIPNLPDDPGRISLFVDSFPVIPGSLPPPFF